MVPTRVRCVSILLDKHRRHIGTSQPKRRPQKGRNGRRTTPPAASAGAHPASPAQHPAAPPSPRAGSCAAAGSSPSPGGAGGGGGRPPPPEGGKQPSGAWLSVEREKRRGVDRLSVERRGADSPSHRPRAAPRHPPPRWSRAEACGSGCPACPDTGRSWRRAGSRHHLGPPPAATEGSTDKRRSTDKRSTPRRSTDSQAGRRAA
eukprot:COSAG01_NODE_48_length_31904_cov_21.696997_23_plen_204_part_00